MNPVDESGALHGSGRPLSSVGWEAMSGSELAGTRLSDSVLGPVSAVTPMVYNLAGQIATAAHTRDAVEAGQL